MARSEAKRQKKLAKHKAKRNEKRREISRAQNLGLAEQLARFENTPIVDCLVNENFDAQGMANLFIGRKAPSGKMALAMILVDMLCMGVKNCFARVVGQGEYRERVQNFTSKGVEKIDPATARRLIEDAIDFAASVGLSPHADYHKVRPILNGVDSADATETFEMGRDGKPYFFSGPGQTLEDCRWINETLRRHCGEGGYESVIRLG